MFDSRTLERPSGYSIISWLNRDSDAGSIAGFDPSLGEMYTYVHIIYDPLYMIKNGNWRGQNQLKKYANEKALIIFIMIKWCLIQRLTLNYLFITSPRYIKWAVLPSFIAPFMFTLEYHKAHPSFTLRAKSIANISWHKWAITCSILINSWKAISIFHVGVFTDTAAFSSGKPY